MQWTISQAPDTWVTQDIQETIIQKNPFTDVEEIREVDPAELIGKRIKFIEVVCGRVIIETE